MRKCRAQGIPVILFLLGLLAALVAACGEPRVEPVQAGPTYSFLDVPVEHLHERTEKYLGAVFEDRFTFEEADPLTGAVRRAGQETKRQPGSPVLARPIAQNSKVIRIRIAPEQEARIREETASGRKTAVRARVRFAGIAPGGLADFELLAVVK